MERHGVLKAYGGISEGYVTKLKCSAQVSSGEGQEDNQDRAIELRVQESMKLEHEFDVYIVIKTKLFPRRGDVGRSVDGGHLRSGSEYSINDGGPSDRLKNRMKQVTEVENQEQGGRYGGRLSQEAVRNKLKKVQKVVAGQPSSYIEVFEDIQGSLVKAKPGEYQDGPEEGRFGRYGQNELTKS
ncbi:hypothetical protein Bca52824_033674 [Brassica carinata]|uniref:Uncharacterized protein n=1 Tax=Brassica carinata TaxID=52824 RepID=A0A8X7SEX7_BRACI|nr:hypothetical protein Bca52824_033674 [Brassica carinata]